MKAHNPALCHAAARRAPKRLPQSAGSASASDSDNAFEELLLGLQDEFGHITLCVLISIFAQVSPLCEPFKLKYMRRVKGIKATTASSLGLGRVVFTVLHFLNKCSKKRKPR